MIDLTIDEAVERPVRWAIPWAGVANVLSAIGNTVAVFSISVAADGTSAFDLFAASLAAVVFCFGVNRAIIGETLTLERMVRLDVRGFIAASVIVAGSLSVLAGGLLALATPTRPLALLTAAAIFGLLVNDDLRHWAFRHRQSLTVAVSDGVWLLVSMLLYALAIGGVVGGRAVFTLWAASGLLVAVPLARVPVAEPGEGRTCSAVEWLATVRRTSSLLAMEAAAASAAVTVPLTAAAMLDVHGQEGGAVRLLQAFFGFQQIAFFSALVTIGRATRTTHALKAGVNLALLGTALSVTVGVVITVLPESLLVALFGPAAGVARSGVWAFVGLHLLISISNGGLLALRVGGLATRASWPRVSGAILGTCATCSLMPSGVAGYAIGSAMGIGLFTVLIVPELARLHRHAPRKVVLG